MGKKGRHVVPNENGGWDVKAPGAGQVSAHTDTKRQAIDRAREIVRDAGGGEVVIHGQSGRFVEGRTAQHRGAMLPSDAKGGVKRHSGAKGGQTTYTARVERDGRFWLIHVPELDRYTQARNLREVEEMARDLVAVMLDVDPGSVVLDVQLVLPDVVREHLEAAERLRAESAAANTAAAAESRAAARELAALGMPIRDIGAALGISHQRAHQLVS